MKNYLTRVHGFKESEMLILMDDGRHHAPTHANIINAFQRITEYSHAGDVVFVHYSGHGGSVVDTSGDEEDGYDETIMVRPSFWRLAVLASPWTLPGGRS